MRGLFFYYRQNYVIYKGMGNRKKSIINQIMLTVIVSVWKYKNLHNFPLNAAAQKSYFAICRLGSVLRWARCIRGISKSLGSTIKCEHSETCFRFSLGIDSTTLILPFPPAASFSNIVISRTLPEESYGVARFFWCDFSKSEFGMRR